ncbi:MANSC domain-containing protein 1 [Dendropsophus ebraccatus]|uniref:MANSC domain-containing protein 1 n=1 Tax=Dendropsophus ebraccatus TaxID=150705 RepID=UPI003831D51A
MDASAPGLSCALLFAALFLITGSGSQKCVPRPIPDMVIDISDAVARGTRFTDPLSVSSEEECLSACCMDRGGDQDCNLLIFDGRKGPGLQNCYIFHCPMESSCPLVPSPGVFTYSLWPDTSSSGKRMKSTDHSKSSGSTIAEHSASEESSDATKSITSRLLHLADKIDRHLEKMESEGDVQVHYPSPTTAIVPAIRTTISPIHREGKKVPPDAKVTKPGKVPYKKPDPTYYSTEAAMPAGAEPIRTLPRPGTSAPKPLPPAASKDLSGTKKVPSSKSAKLPTGHHVAMATAKVKGPLSHTEGKALATVHQTRAPQMVTHPAPLQTSPWKGTDKLSAGDERNTSETHPSPQEDPDIHLEEAPRKAESARSGLPSLEDKSGLVAALVFGLLFLMVVIGLVSRKVSEARRRHRYTKLDYLINGMYVDT